MPAKLRYVLPLLLLAASPCLQAAEPTDGLTLTAEELAQRPALSLVPEMQIVPEADGWPATDAGAFADASAGFHAEWAKLAPWVGTKVTPAVARALSRWSAAQMKDYAAVPPLDKLKFVPVAALKDRRVVVFQANLDRLPTHSPLVTRHLIAYVCYNVESKSIARVTITIRGHVEE
jgi:hypothetical protein